jgi:glutathione S-transferase
MKIYDFKGFPNPARVRIAAAEKALTERIKFISVDVPAGEHKRPEFLTMNPFGTVPTLELDDGTVITECTAITEYLDNIDGSPILTGRNARERAMIHMMQRRAEVGLLDAATDYFHYATPGLGPDIESHSNKAWGEYRASRAIAGMRYFNDLLSQQPYLAGDAFSMADITAFAGMTFADFVKLETPTDLEHLTVWRNRVAARPSIAAA